jgi:nucleotide-binding universal stress UspA family protein
MSVPIRRRGDAFAGALLGAVSLRCAAAAPCPVVLVKLRGEGMPQTETS